MSLRGHFSFLEEREGWENNVRFNLETPRTRALERSVAARGQGGSFPLGEQGYKGPMTTELTGNMLIYICNKTALN